MEEVDPSTSSLRGYSGQARAGEDSRVVKSLLTSFHEKPIIIMEDVKNTNKQLWITIGIVAGMIGFVALIQPKLTQNANDQTISNHTPTPSSVSVKSISYKGQNGTDALSLLKTHHTVEQDKSGLVVRIDTYKASAAKREYWAFYINGKLAQVGPQAYKTLSTDVIAWKIVTY